MSEPDGAPPDSEAQVSQLVSELTHVRRRGLDGIDHQDRGQEPVVVPALEALARRFAGDTRGARGPLIRRLLEAALQACVADGYEEEARLVRRLFFGRDGGTPGRERPGELLAKARAGTGLTDDAFDTRRRAVFRLFAGLLIAVGEAPPEAAPVGIENPNPTVESLGTDGRDDRAHSPNRGRLAVLLAVLTLAGLILGLTLRRDGGGDSGIGDQPPPSAAFTFDDLGGGSSVIRVFPGVTDSLQDRRSNGTFLSGQTATAVCKTRGRLVKSDQNVGEQPRESDTWLKIAGSPGLVQFATLTYGTIETESLAQLPTCTATS